MCRRIIVLLLTAAMAIMPAIAGATVYWEDIVSSLNAKGSFEAEGITALREDNTVTVCGTGDAVVRCKAAAHDSPSMKITPYTIKDVNRYVFEDVSVYAAYMSLRNLPDGKYTGEKPIELVVGENAAIYGLVDAYMEANSAEAADDRSNQPYVRVENNGLMNAVRIAGYGEKESELVNRGTIIDVTVRAESGMDTVFRNSGSVEELEADSFNEDTMSVENSGYIGEVELFSNDGSLMQLGNSGLIDSLYFSIDDQSRVEVTNDMTIASPLNIYMAQNEQGEIGSLTIGGNGRIQGTPIYAQLEYYDTGDKDVSTAEKRRQIIDELLEGVSIASSQYGTLKTVDIDIFLCRNAVNTDFEDKLVGDVRISYELKNATENPRAYIMDKQTEDELKAALDLFDEKRASADKEYAEQAEENARIREKVASQMQLLGSLRPGDVVVMGHYEQDNNPDNGPEPVEWVVMSTDGDTATMISKYGLELHDSDQSASEVYWNTSSMFRWLNGEFRNALFDSSEIGAAKVLYTYRSYKGYLTLPSKEEVEAAFPDEVSRRTAATASAIARGAKLGESGSCAWLTRSSGDEYVLRWSYVRSDGSFGEADLKNTAITIRPSFVLELDKIQCAQDVYRPEPQEKPAEEDCPPMFATGNVLTFGRYEQDNKTSNGTEPIEWIVLTHKDGRALLLSRQGLDVKPYHDEEVSVTWETCSLRAWLNGEFCETAFGEAERQALVLSNIVTNAGNNTQDRVFVLSADEATEYLQGDDAKRTGATRYASKRGAYDDGNKNAYWWMRTRDTHESGVLLFSVAAWEGPKAFGSPVSWYFRYADYPVNTKGVTVRPAIWVEMDSACFSQSTVTAAPSAAAQVGSDQVMGRVRIKSSGSVNVREESDQHSQVIGRVRNGEEYDYLTVADNGWVQIVLDDGSSGFVSGKLVKILH